MALRLGEHLMSLHDRLRFEPVTQRIRCSLDGRPVCDTSAAALVWETGRVVPRYAVPRTDLTAELVPCASRPVPEGYPSLPGSRSADFDLHLDPGDSFDVRVGDRTVPAAAFRPEDPDLDGRVVLSWDPFDWKEEAEPVTGHPHDVFKRVDVLATKRQVLVSARGVVLADSRDAFLLLETHLPPRWYLPRADVDMHLLTPSETRTVCAYKGEAAHYSLTGGGIAGEDIAWTYPAPLQEAFRVKDRICFYSERTDLTVDGERVHAAAAGR